MEVVGLSIGAVALVPLFTTCVECFEYIDLARSCGRDLELLTTKFAIEKARLLIWAESMGITSSNTAQGTKTESPHVRPIIEQILNCIRMLFEDTTTLNSRYGLKLTRHDKSSLVTDGSTAPTNALGLPLRLKASYVRFKSRIEQNHKQTSIANKSRWAIHDRQKFASLIDDIHQFIDGLEAVTGSLDVAAKRAALVREELSNVEDPEDLRLIAEASAGVTQQWSDAASLALEASSCGESGYDRIRDWMSAVSNCRRSTVAEAEGSEASHILFEADSSDGCPPFSLGNPDIHLIPCESLNSSSTTHFSAHRRDRNQKKRGRPSKAEAGNTDDTDAAQDEPYSPARKYKTRKLSLHEDAIEQQPENECLRTSVDRQSGETYGSDVDDHVSKNHEAWRSGSGDPDACLELTPPSSHRHIWARHIWADQTVLCRSTTPSSHADPSMHGDNDHEVDQYLEHYLDNFLPIRKLCPAVILVE
ncbi:MAG: hypothetical protein Q9213_003641 [Squamulea squamosa]